MKALDLKAIAQKAIELALEIKGIKKEKEDALGPTKVVLEMLSKDYDDRLAPLLIESEEIRLKIMSGYEGTDTIKLETGSVVFPQRWTFEVRDINKIDRKYLTIDTAKVKEEMKNGITKINGISIFQKRGIEVRTK